MSELKKFYVGAKGLIIKDNRVLLLWHDKNGRQFWDMPGGRINDDETSVMALRRELSEELPNVKNVEVGNLLYAHRIEHDVENEMGLFLIVYAVQADFVGDVAYSDEHDGCTWMRLEEAQSRTSSVVAEAIKAYHKRK